MHGRFSMALLVLAVASAPAAGQFEWTSPDGYGAREGEVSAAGPGTYKEGRFMFFNGFDILRVPPIKGMAFRLDNHVYDSSSGAGREWSNVQIHASECDFSKLSETFANNPTTTPMRVFSSAVKWPARTGKPGSLPAAWDLQFPFSTSFSYSTKNGICLDFTFRGGVLANGGTWGSTLIPYRLDAALVGDERIASSTTIGRTGSDGCNDRGSPFTEGAELATVCTHWSPDYFKPGFAGKARFTQTGKRFGKNAPVVTLLGGHSNRVGLPYAGVTCNKLYVFQWLGVFWQTSDASGNLPVLDFGKPFHDSVPGLGGTELATQAAWADTKNGRLLISAATSLWVPEVAPARRRAVLYSSDLTSATGTGPTTNQGVNAIALYTR